MNPTRIRRLDTEVSRASRIQMRLEQAHSAVAGSPSIADRCRTVMPSILQIVPRADLLGRANIGWIGGSVAHAALAC
jgi:hypothetical protein